ncbi:hypothetical protein [Bifidobacterium tsurumiense]|uniref:hypothetical protein n=1 Tax=Bifidobacterium tsurumiense TaxID=356829 RepID=UPI0012B33414|nr:hypothetical protein [Bifidobacterium tsurumiense]MSS13318.1 hypothetical protein [Bifidobacterium tsurumiense]
MKKNHTEQLPVSRLSFTYCAAQCKIPAMLPYEMHVHHRDEPFWQIIGRPEVDQRLISPLFKP